MLLAIKLGLLEMYDNELNRFRTGQSLVMEQMRETSWEKHQGLFVSTSSYGKETSCHMLVGPRISTFFDTTVRPLSVEGETQLASGQDFAESAASDALRACLQAAFGFSRRMSDHAVAMTYQEFKKTMINI